LIAANWIGLLAVAIPGIVALFVARSSSPTPKVANRSESLEQFNKLRIALQAELDSAL
jgi:hypothetical protein